MLHCAWDHCNYMVVTMTNLLKSQDNTASWAEYEILANAMINLCAQWAISLKANDASSPVDFLVAYLAINGVVCIDKAMFRL